MIVSNVAVLVVSVIVAFVETERALTTDILHQHNNIVNQYFRKRLLWKTSNLGSLLFKNYGNFPSVSRNNQMFTISIYKQWRLDNYRFSSNHKRSDPLSQCNVKNCQFVGKDSIDDTHSDVVLFYIFNGDIPNLRRFNQRQIWVFFFEESPLNVLAGTKKFQLKLMYNIFNWSMTYRSDSDVPVPYGRTVALEKPIMSDYFNLSHKDVSKLVPYWNKKKRDVLITVLMSRCVPHRLNYIKHLKKLIQLDFYGRCSHHNPFKYRCPGYMRADCRVLTRYLFYLVLENSNCRQYITEKVFYNAYSKGAIPVIRGTPLEDCEKLLPPDSFLHENQFKTPEELVRAIVAIAKDDKKLLSYHRWRNHFKVTNEHGFFRSEANQFCRLCQALNYNDLGHRVYSENDIKQFLDQKLLCNENKLYKERFKKKKFSHKNKSLRRVARRTEIVQFKTFFTNASIRIDPDTLFTL